jgi:hypothetical protein
MHMIDSPAERQLMVSARSGHLSTEIQGETVILELSSGQYYGLNAVGSRIWQLIQSPMLVTQLVEQVLMEFEVSREELQRDIISLLEELRESHLVDMTEVLASSDSNDFV